MSWTLWTVHKVMTHQYTMQIAEYVTYQWLYKRFLIFLSIYLSICTSICIPAWVPVLVFFDSPNLIRYIEPILRKITVSPDLSVLLSSIYLSIYILSLLRRQTVLIVNVRTQVIRQNKDHKIYTLLRVKYKVLLVKRLGSQSLKSLHSPGFTGTRLAWGRVGVQQEHYHKVRKDE